MGEVLILGGTGLAEEAREVLLAARHDVILHGPRDPDGFGQLRARAGRAACILDASHGFDDHTWRIARGYAPDCPLAHLQRPTWTAAHPGEWTHVADLPAAMAALPRGARVFAATGRESVEVLAQHDGPVFLRQLQPHDDPALGQCRFVFGAGPFDVAAEQSLLTELGIDVVLARNVGGRGSFPKIAAARALGLRVVMIDPRPRTGGPVMSTVEAARAWVKDYLRCA